MALEDLLRAERLPWFAAGGQDADVVLSSRVRLARNLLRLPFPGRADEDQLAEIRRILDEALADISTAFGQPFERIVVRGSRSAQPISVPIWGSVFSSMRTIISRYR